MAYEYDIFISYRRLGETRSWVHSYLIPLLENHLSQELGRPPRIFVDTEIEIGDTWPEILLKALSSSRIIIILWSKTFRESKWCTREVGHMLEREKKFGFRSPVKPAGLIFPLIIHDGETIPNELNDIQSLNLKEFYKMTLNKDGEKHTLFEDMIKSQSSTLSAAINNVPDWKQSWDIPIDNPSASELYVDQSAGQLQPPKFAN